MNSIVIRAAADADAETIVEIMHAAFQDYAGVLHPPSGVHQESASSVRAKMQQGTWLLAEQDGRAVGCVFAEPQAEYVYLGRLAVLPEMRGRGIGDALITAVQEHARAAGFRRVRLSVRVALPKMRAAYERRGYVFVEAHTHEGFAEPTYVTLEKALDARG